LCGECFVVCPQNAKEIVDETEKVKVLINSGAPVYASFAPSFAANYEGIGIGGMRKALKKLGFADAEETAVGACIVKKEYERILNEDKPEILISSCCHSVNLLIQKHYPNELQYLADVLSPMQAHALDIKKRHPDAKVVFIGPCVAKKDEVNSYSSYDDAALTFEELSRWLADEKINLEPDMDSDEHSRTRMFPTSGGIIGSMDLNDEYSYVIVDGTENCIRALNDIEAGNISKCFIEMSACPGSCVNGPVMEKFHNAPVRGFAAVRRYAGRYDYVTKKYRPEQLAKNMQIIEQTARIPTETEIEATLRKMGKYKPEDELNCGSCGYETCRLKAVAIIQGKADISMCLPFLKEKAENFSDNIISNTPNGIIVVNEELEVQQINKSALTMMNLRRDSDVLGEQVVRILDPEDFIKVRDTGRQIHSLKKYLAEYDKYVEETIVYDREYHVLICIMRDVTQEAKETQRKDDITKQTVETADKVVEKQMRIAQEIALLLGETTAETKVALSKLKESVSDE
jgi:iron only hydrogenase large subunit-like protein